ncbi:MAG: ATP-binding cassette domain-containing protein [bacterium]
MLSVNGLEVDIGTANILRGVALTVEEGNMCGLIGRNGAGKTTLMRSVMGLVSAQAGSVTFAGTDLLAIPAHRRVRLGIGYMPEDRRLVPQFTTEENLRLPAWVIKMADIDARLEWVYGLMPEVRDFAQRRANQLSGGQQKMVALARALVAGTKLLLLDEPFEGLAPALAGRLAEVLSKLKTEGLTVLVAESNERHIAHLLAATYVIERGQITAG